MKNLLDGKFIDAASYALRHQNNLGFERDLIGVRQNACLRCLKRVMPDKVLEAGCGPFLLAERAFEEEVHVKQWDLIEPSHEFVVNARDRLSHHSWFHAHEGYLEDSIEQLNKPESGYDMILLSGLLHETSKPNVLIEAAKKIISTDGVLVITVPNANSFHRLLAVEMGIISDSKELSDRNKLLGQPLIYDEEKLITLLRSSGFKVIDCDGYFAKFLNNEHMQVLKEMLGDNFVDGLDKLGQNFPKNAAEICMIAKLLN